MFSGIVETTGKITELLAEDGCKHFVIAPTTPYAGLALGDSIAVNGVCLTVTNFTDTDFHVTAVPETLNLTNLNALKVGSLVNLERSITLSTRLGGHYVQGHVDAMGEILDIQQADKKALLVKIGMPEKLNKYIVNKGYITLDGMSITVIESAPTWFTVTFIPHTQDVTIIKQYAVGTFINIEVDIMGKYVEKLLGVHTHAGIH
ncbi:MAG: riboflavin synthase [Gammaproteobacteria bacterium]